LSQGLLMTDALLLEYAEGLPMAQVGWGRLTRADLTDLLSVHTLYFDYTQKTYFCAQAQGSNLARHLIQTLDQAVSGQAVPGAIGPPGQKLAVVLGHDTNIINLAGLLDLSWYIPGGAVDPVLPGCSLVFELRKGDDGVQRIRIFYASQTLDGMHRDEPIDAAHPPALAPIFIPGCSESSPGYDAPLAKFEEKLERAIDPRFVVAGSN
jgi:4-phytase/acid phosphatase